MKCENDSVNFKDKNLNFQNDAIPKKINDFNYGFSMVDSANYPEETFKSIEGIEEEIKDSERIANKLENLKKGHGVKMSTQDFLKELGRW